MVNLLHHFLSKKGQIILKGLTFDGEFVLNTFNRMSKYISGQFEPLKVLVEKFDVMMTAKKPIISMDQLLKIFSLELYEIEVNLKYFKAALLDENLKDVTVANEEGKFAKAVVAEKHTLLQFKILRDKVAYIQRDMLIVGRILEMVIGITVSYLVEIDS